jgi:hypothetical protein
MVKLTPEQQILLDNFVDVINLTRNGVVDEIANKLLAIDEQLADSNPAKGIYAHAAQIAYSSKAKDK